MDMTARRAPRGSVSANIGIFAAIDPELHAAFEAAVTDRNITKRELIEAALRRELEQPTTVGRSPQEALYNVAS